MVLINCMASVQGVRTALINLFRPEIALICKEAEEDYQQHYATISGITTSCNG